MGCTDELNGSGALYRHRVNDHATDILSCVASPGSLMQDVGKESAVRAQHNGTLEVSAAFKLES